jgi:protein-S-isoprenylcysteine O-methyltransferase Ste14
MLKALSILAYFGMIGGLLALLLTKNVFSPSVFVIAPQVAAVCLMIWARITFGRRSFHVAANPTEGGLVTTGPYRFIRHPIYTAIFAFTVPGTIAHLGWPSAVLELVIIACGLARLFFEEKLVLARYPAYELYAATTPRMIPFVF